MAAFENIFGGGKPGMEANITMTYLGKHPGVAAACKEVFEAVETIREAYADVLNGGEICRAKMIAWGCDSAQEYRHLFLVDVLMNAYKVFDKSHARYEQILQAIREKNPEWEEPFVRNHEQRILNCKVAVV